MFENIWKYYLQVTLILGMASSPTYLFYLNGTTGVYYHRQVY